MAYRSVGTPRFYIDQLIYLKSTGIDLREYYNDKGLGYSQDNPVPDSHGGDGYSIYPFEYPEAFSLTPNQQYFFKVGYMYDEFQESPLTPEITTSVEDGDEIASMDISSKCWYVPEWADDPVSVLTIDLARRDTWRKSAWTGADNIKHLETLQSYLEGKDSNAS